MKTDRVSCWCSASLLALAAMLVVAPARAGSIFLTGHDPDFHALSFEPEENPAGSKNINTVAINFVTDPAANDFTASAIDKFLFVESKIVAPEGHRNGVDGIVASGFTLGADFEHHDAGTLSGELDLLGTKYNAIVVGSDFGGVLTQAELDILNVRSGDIIDFLNASGGLYALAQSNEGQGLTPDGGHYGFLPFIVSSTSFTAFETGNTVTAFGASLGLTDADFNGNFSHNFFSGTGGLLPVDLFNGNLEQPLSLAFRGFIDSETGVVAEPDALWLLCIGLAMLALLRAIGISMTPGRPRVAPGAGVFA